MGAGKKIGIGVGIVIAIFVVLAIIGYSVSSNVSTGLPKSDNAQNSQVQTIGNEPVIPTSESQCDQSLWQHVYNPSRLQVLDNCITATGIIRDIRAEADGDYHVLVQLDDQYTNLINTENFKAQSGYLVVEPVCQLAVSQEDAKDSCATFSNHIDIPAVGSHVKITGSYVLDKEHGSWAEIHPLSAIAVIEETTPIATTEPTSVRNCIPGMACFVSGDFLKYSTFLDGKLFWEKTLTYEGEGFSGADKIAVGVHDVDPNGPSMIIGSRQTNVSDSAIDVDLRVGITDGTLSGKACCYNYFDLMPSPVNTDKWLKGSSPEYWKNRVQERAYVYNGWNRTVIHIQDGNFEQIIDKQTGILLLLNNTSMQGGIEIIKLTGTNIINSDSTDFNNVGPAKFQLSVTPEKYTISRGSSQTIQVKVTDENGKPVEDVLLTATVTYASGSTKSFSGISDNSGIWIFSWQIGGNSNPGTFHVNVTASKAGYENGSGSSSFAVTTAS